MPRVAWEVIGANPARPNGFRAHLGSGAEVSVYPMSKKERAEYKMPDGWRAYVLLGIRTVCPPSPDVESAKACGLAELHARALAVAAACVGGC